MGNGNSVMDHVVRKIAVDPRVERVADDLAAWGTSYLRARHFGVKPKKTLPAYDGEHSRIAKQHLSEQYWSGIIDMEHLRAGREEIERACRSYFVRGRVAYKKASHPRSVIRALLVERDGTDCWFCGKHMPPSDRTIEHLEARANGGADDPENLRLCHEACNKLLADLPVETKRMMRDEIRAAA